MWCCYWCCCCCSGAVDAGDGHGAGTGACAGSDMIPTGDADIKSLFLVSDYFAAFFSMKSFSANYDKSSAHFIDLPVKFNARFVRIYPTNWYNAICLRVELYGCDGKLYVCYWEVTREPRTQATLTACLYGVTPGKRQSGGMGWIY